MNRAKSPLLILILSALAVGCGGGQRKIDERRSADAAFLLTDASSDERQPGADASKEAGKDAGQDTVGAPDVSSLVDLAPTPDLEPELPPDMGSPSDVVDQAVAIESGPEVLPEVRPEAPSRPEVGSDGPIGPATYLFGRTFAAGLPSSVAVDSTGDVYIAGAFGNNSAAFPLNFGGGNLFAPKSDVDGYIAKLSPTGEHRWSRQITDAEGETTGYDQAVAGIALDGAGHLIVMGQGNVAINFGVGVDPVQSDNNSGHSFVASYDAATGAPLWAQGWKLSDKESAYVKSIAVDRRDNSIIIAGSLARSSGSATTKNVFGCMGALRVAMSSVSQASDAFVAKLNPSDGSCVWVKSFGADATSATSTNIDRAWAVAVDSAGQIALTGSYSSGFSVGGLPALPGPSDGTAHGIFVLKLGSDGAPLWSRGFTNSTTAADSTPSAIATGDDGSVVVTGQISGSFDFGGGTLVVDSADRWGDVFVLKLDPQGQHVWSRRFGDSTVGTEIGLTVTVDARGNALVGGSIHGATESSGMVAMANYAAFLTLLDGGTGQYITGMRSAGTTAQPSGTFSVAISPVDENWWTSGQYLGSLSLGGIARPELTNTLHSDQVTFLVSIKP